MALSEDLQAIKMCLEFLVSEDERTYFRTHFHDLCCIWMRKGSQDTSSQKDHVACGYALNDLASLALIIERLVWTHTEASVGYRRGLYVGLDLEFFHVQMRSIMDYVARIMALSLRIEKKANTESFHKFKNWIAKCPKRVPPEVLPIMNSTDWFDDLRKVRDGFVHFGALSAVFGTCADGILFQVLFKSRHPHVVPTHFLHDGMNNVIRFDRYAAINLAHLFVFLSEISKVLLPKVDVDNMAGQEARSHSFGDGYTILRNWMAEFVDTFDTPIDTQDESNGHSQCQ